MAGKRNGMSKACPVCGWKAVGNAEETVCPECGHELEYTRSGLFMEQIRIIKEMRQNDRNHGRAGMLVRPRYCIWENVPGALSSNNGKDFQAVLTEFARVGQPDAPDVPMPETGKWPKAGCIYDELGGGPLPIASMTHSIGEFRSDADGFLSLPISTDFPQRKYYLTLNCGEKPRVPNPTKLSEILVDNPDPKYRLSPKACQGILNRAERRGKELPPELKAALEAQSLSKSEPVNLGGQRNPHSV